MSESQKDDHSYGRDEVVKIINSVIEKVEHTGDISREAIFAELKELQQVINEVRTEIGATNPGDINSKHIPTATDELDAIIEATAEATGTIMDSCEAIEEKVGSEENGAAISEEVTKIYEACSFQDITGQRITKTVSALKQIEEKVSKLVAVLGSKMPGTEEEGDGDTRTGDEALLNGPQMADQAISQEEIDKLLADF